MAILPAISFASENRHLDGIRNIKESGHGGSAGGVKSHGQLHVDECEAPPMMNPEALKASDHRHLVLNDACLENVRAGQYPSTLL